MLYFKRSLSLPLNQNILLFGARNTGKSTLLRHTFNSQQSLWIDLLDYEEEERYRRNPARLISEVQALDDSVTHVVIDEVQKLPQLLNAVHYLIENTNKKFVMTGSSARKLKSANVNLLAGRAFVYELFPFTQEELGEQFDLSQVLNWGTLPALYTRHQEESERKQFLQNYSKTYLKEEIWYEQFIRKMDPFLRFLEIAAQMNGEILNYSAIALDTGVDDKTIKNYFSILEETLIGVFLPPYLSSVRKTTSKSKFYFFDTGIVKALTNTLSIPLVEFSSPFGKAFEHFIIIEILRLSSYAQSDFKFFYLRTKDGAEVDLVVERPQEKKLFIEIKSTVDVREDHLRNLKQLAKDHDAEAVCFSRDKRAWKSDNATVYPWAEGMKKFFRKAED